MSEKKKISVTFGERAHLVAVLNGFKGNMSDLSVILDDVKSVRISKEDFEKVDAKNEIDPKTGMATGAKSWSEEKADAFGDTEIELSDVAVDFVKKHVDDLSKKNALTIRQAGLIALRKKLS